jgi:hypothetical protein
MKVMNKGLFAATTACVILLCGCSTIRHALTTPKAPVSQIKPARESNTEHMNRIAVIHDRLSPVGGSILETNLSGIKFDNSPYFTLVERSRIDSIIKEQKLNDGMLTNSATRIKLGQLTGADTLISASYSTKINSSNYSEERSECVEKGDNWYKCKKRREYTVSCTKKTAAVIFKPKAVSVESGEIIFSKNYSEIVDTKFCKDKSESMDTDEQLVGKALARITKELKFDLAPYIVTTDVELMTNDDSNMPENAEKLFSQGINFAYEGMFEGACKLFSKAQSKYASSIAITYNNAVCAEFLADVEMADAFYSKAMTMTDDIDELKLVMEGETRIKQRLIDVDVLSKLASERL